jgi:hypothetical protein
MCFFNNEKQLAKVRALKKPITVWKKGRIDDKTGRVTTSNPQDHSPNKKRIVWIPKTVVKPDKIRKPLGHNKECSSGLYFYTSKFMIGAIRNTYKGLVKAQVDPKDVIAVSDDGYTICSVAATVIDAPNPDQRLWRLDYLKKTITYAQQKMKRDREVIQSIEIRHIEEEEAYAQMLDEVKELELV